MAVTLTPRALQRVEEQQREHLARLAAQAAHYVATPDPLTPGGWIVRNPKVPYRIELVNDQGQCTCRHYRLWDRCKHAALVSQQTTSAAHTHP